MVYSINTVPLDTVTWTPISAAFNAQAVILWNNTGATIKLRSNASDPTTEKPLYPSVQQIIQPGILQNIPRFPKGLPFLWAQATSGTGPLTVDSMQ